jgi:hypothetical protein
MKGPLRYEVANRHELYLVSFKKLMAQERQQLVKLARQQLLFAPL